MAFTLPNPTTPTNGQSGDATPILQNEQALANAIASFDGSQVQTATIQGSALVANANPLTLLGDSMFPFVASGCVWSGDSYGSTLNGSMTSGIVYVQNPSGQLVRLTATAISAHAFTASTDTYIDIDYNGNVTFTGVSNNSVSPALAANSVRLAIVVSGASSIAAATSINQGQETAVLPIASSIAYSVTDSLGNLICPRDPQRRVLGYRQVIGNQTGITTQADVTGLSCPVIVPANRKIHISTFIASTDNTLDAYNLFYIMEGATQLQVASANMRSNSVPEQMKPEVITSPSSGLHTYKVQAQGSGGTAAVNASSTSPAFIKVALV